MILHIPHSSTKMINGVTVPNLQDNLNQITDWFTDELFEHDNRIVFPYSRLCVDVERFENDAMDRFGKGVIYWSDINGEDIERRVSGHTLMVFYRFHHAQLFNSVTENDDTIVVVDCHSFPNKPLPWEDKSVIERPDICLGVDEDCTPDDLKYRLIDYFIKNDLMVQQNYPYVGTIIPVKKKNVKSIMIEVNRKLYLDDKYNKNKNFSNTKCIIDGALNIISQWEDNENFRQDNTYS